MDQQTSEGTGNPAGDPAKSKYRPQQSCIKCRERKVKCDRVKPCRACCARGLQSECEYVTNSEDRFQIRQSDIIDNLRKEVNRLKRNLADSEQSNQPIQPFPTNAAFSLQRKALTRTAEDPAPSILMPNISDAGLFPSSVRPESFIEINEESLPYQSGGSVDDGSGFGSQASGGGPVVESKPPTNSIVPYDAVSDDPWGCVNPVFDANYYDTPALTSRAEEYGLMEPEGQLAYYAEHDTSWAATTVGQSQIEYWKEKHDTLQGIFNTICDCDEAHVASIIEIIRNSTTPEDAMMSIHQTTPSPYLIDAAGVPDEMVMASAGDYSTLE